MEPLIDTDATTRPVPDGIEPWAWAAVLKGSALLDSIPELDGWSERIDPDRFDIGLSQSCVLGYQPDGWCETNSLIEDLSPVALTDRWTVEYGFDIHVESPAGAPVSLEAIRDHARALTAAWRAYLWPVTS